MHVNAYVGHLTQVTHLQFHPQKMETWTPRACRLGRRAHISELWVCLRGLASGKERWKSNRGRFNIQLRVHLPVCTSAHTHSHTRLHVYIPHRYTLSTQRGKRKSISKNFSEFRKIKDSSYQSFRSQFLKSRHAVGVFSVL